MNKKSLNNKGFSLVELIIVMAIMAVLVGALAPQYVKYLDKSKVSVDTQLADSLRQAIEITLIDPTIDNPDSLPDEEADNTKIATDGSLAFWDEVYDIMGVVGHDNVVKSLSLDTTLTGDAADIVSITYWVDPSNNNVTVKIAGGKYTGNNEIKVD